MIHLNVIKYCTPHFICTESILLIIYLFFFFLQIPFKIGRFSPSITTENHLKIHAFERAKHVTFFFFFFFFFFTKTYMVSFSYFNGKQFLVFIIAKFKFKVIANCCLLGKTPSCDPLISSQKRLDRLSKNREEEEEEENVKHQGYILCLGYLATID